MEETWKNLPLDGVARAAGYGTGHQFSQKMAAPHLQIPARVKSFINCFFFVFFFKFSLFFVVFFVVVFFLFVEGLNWPKKLARLAKWTAFRFKAGFGPRKRWTSFWLELNQLFIRQVCVAIMVQQFFADSPKSNIHHFSFDWNCNYECFSLVFLGGGGGGGDGSAA